MRFHFRDGPLEDWLTCCTCGAALKAERANAHAARHSERGDQPHPAAGDLDNVTIIEVDE